MSLSRLPQALLPWYEQNKRLLPWRQDRNPYHVWLSEIMLQQTRVVAVKGYYARFLQTLPTVEALAKCDDDTLHKLWEGLGYYTRVRNLKKCANIIVEQYSGQFPQSYEEMLKLPGIGPYTAGAICSICWDLPTPAVDGNVLRVITRLTEDATPVDCAAYQIQVREMLSSIYPKEAGKFTQALMELGATLCGPNRAPDCHICPCKDFCQSAKHATAENFPVKSPKKPRRSENLTVFILSCGDLYALEKRPNKGLLAGLWQFPNVLGTLSVEQALTHVQDLGLRPANVLRQAERSHIFTHIQWNMRGIYLEVDRPDGNFIWHSRKQIREAAALPTAFRQFWEE